MLPHGAQGSWEGSAVYLAKELRDTRIRVNAADPGYTATDFNALYVRARSRTSRVARPRPVGVARLPGPKASAGHSA
jgi:NAD(P)-dependent dehydrogenase (short-subunit alcohol dehydrogenase family)